MVILIAGASHTGKTLLSKRLVETYHYSCLSIDHLKMGLIRSGQTSLTPMDDELLTDYLWPILREMIKTAIENRQDLIIEGCYIPFTWQKDFSPDYLSQIRYRCLIMSEHYIRSHFEDIKGHANIVEHRLDDSPGSGLPGGGCWLAAGISGRRSGRTGHNAWSAEGVCLRQRRYS